VLLEVVTGKGSHSASRVPHMRAAVLRYLRDCEIGYRIGRENWGVVHARLGSGWEEGEGRRRPQ